MKINELHELNIIFLMLLEEKFSSAVEYLFDKMVEFEREIKKVKFDEIDLDEEKFEKEIKLFSKDISRRSI